MSDRTLKSRKRESRFPYADLSLSNPSQLLPEPGVNDPMNFRANSIRPYLSKTFEKPFSAERREPARAARTEKKPTEPTRRSTTIPASRKPLTDEQQGLAARYIPMAKALAKPLKFSWPNEGEEFESAALLALVEAAQSFDPSRNVKFATFARFRIWGALRDVQRGLIASGWRGDIENAPILTSLALDAEEHGKVLGSEPDAPTGSEIEGLEYVESLFKKIPARHAEACREIYIKGLSHGQAAKSLGCSKSRLCYLHREALDMITDAVAYENRYDTMIRDPQASIAS